jgi:iron only hydrogenase large subunit-like protein/nitrogen-specific signal transduction histidine kinase
MENLTEYKLVYTIKDRCRVCYTCVRECPVKAIKIINGQAEIIPERCIACGNCTRVCSQGAKAYFDSTHRIIEMLDTGDKVYALLAPSFVAEFSEFGDYRKVIGMLRKLGFDKVFEVGFGADLVAAEYSKIMGNSGVRGMISSDCPAIVSFVEKYQPELVGNLAPIVSPMIAMSRYLRQKDKGNYKMVFIGPCIAKKAETHELDEQITFTELRKLFELRGVDSNYDFRSEFNDPVAGKGAIFPISRGLMQTVMLPENEIEGHVIVAEGKENFQEAIREYRLGAISGEHLELLCCEGCIMGPGTTKNGKKFSRRAKVLDYLKVKMENFDRESWQKAMDKAATLDLSQSFYADDQRIHDPSEKEIREVLKSMNKHKEMDNLNCGACGYDTCRNHAIAIIKGLAENEMCLPNSIEKLHHSINELAVSNEKLFSVQQTLRQTEKLAHMGQLSAGIAHELNNPLGVVIMYSNILLEEAEADSPLKTDLKLIVEQAQRCKTIVGGLLNFARKNQVSKTETDLNDLIRLSISSVIIPDNVHIDMDSNMKDPLAEIDKEQMTQVVTNLIKNAFEAMPRGGRINISLEDTEPDVTIKISDTGTGINPDDLQKVFEPFFTTKGIGKGTGLGLATAYGVVKMHKGNIKVESNAEPSKGQTGTTFTITLPRKSLT